MSLFSDYLQPITYSEFSDVDSVYNNFDIFILCGFTSGSPRFDLLGKFNKSTNKFSFRDIVYNPDKHDTYLYIDPSHIPRNPREPREKKVSRLSSFGYNPKRRGGEIYTKTIQQLSLNIINIIIFK
jgi:hypothetical protein